MILAIDIGNTHIVLGGIENGTIRFEARLTTDALKTVDEYQFSIMNILSLYGVEPAALEGTIISSVVPPVLSSIRTAACAMTGRQPLVVGPGMKTGLNIHVDNPKQVGSDLIVAGVAGVHTYGAPLILIDLGTATTLSVIDQSPAFLGCCICPGVSVSLEALTSRTAQLPGISLEPPRKAIGKNTVDSMRSGILLGTAAMLDGMIDRLEEELGQKTTVVGTGGIARHIIPLCRRPIQIDNSLILRGLDILYHNNVR